MHQFNIAFLKNIYCWYMMTLLTFFLDLKLSLFRTNFSFPCKFKIERVHCSYMLYRHWHHCVKSVQIRSFFWSEYRKIRTKRNSVFGDFSGSASLFPFVSVLASAFKYKHGLLHNINCG